MTPELSELLEAPDNQNATSLLPAPEPAEEPEDRQDKEADGRLR